MAKNVMNDKIIEEVNNFNYLACKRLVQRLVRFENKRGGIQRTLKNKKSSGQNKSLDFLSL
jgi:hypothetical protein